MQSLHSPGALVGDRYTVQGKLGQGAMGTTYAAVDIHTQQAVALKAVSFSETQDWKVLEMFEREAQTLAQLSHPCIPQYLGCFHLDTPRDRHLYLVQERIVGHSLETLIRNRGWRPDETLVQKIALQVLEILEYLHTHHPPVIHRDIKPHNLIRTPDGEMVLVDFGAVQQAFCHTLSRGGTFIGTVDYMPPEQFRGEATFASDLYSLGVTLLDLLTGPNTIAELPTKRLKLDFREAVEISTAFADWLDRLIEPATEDRFQSSQIAKQVLLEPNIITDKTQHPESKLAPSYALELEYAEAPSLLFESRIRLYKADDCFEVIIPPVWDGGCQLICCSILIGFCIIFKALFGIKILLSILFLLIIFNVLDECRLLWSFFGYFALRIDPDHCQLYWTFSFLKHVIYRRTNKLIKVGIAQDNLVRISAPVCAFFSDYLQSPLIFGTWLKQHEKDFVVAEVNQFLENLRRQSS
ncbi:MAG: serine/threonine protein kinase [Spirulina sp. SIO3F2]|nr:serine/threonine protein kinase [Spirulina sp. SIO3F2]